jgi:hypothetical protein|tara:strand:- start:5136 stop:6371 length:1236 start_codon:yes stop_codon:yes gene_type:complete
MKVTINLDKNIFPKLFNYNDEELNNIILNLLNIGYQNVYSSVNEKKLINNIDNSFRRYKDDIILDINNNNNNIKDKISLLESNLNNLNVDNKLNEFSNIVNKLFGINNNSCKKGEISEKLIYDILSQKFKNYNYEKKNHISHHADGELTSSSGFKSLVEIKNYNHVVNKDELDKFKYDLKYTNNSFGIFLSLQSGIVGKNIIDYEIYDDNIHIIYISKLMDDINKLDYGIILSEILFKMNSTSSNDIKIEEITSKIKNKFNELDVILKKTVNLRVGYEKLELDIKNNLNIFYSSLRDYEMELKLKMDDIWRELINDLSKNYVDMKSKFLLEMSKKDKCYKIMERIFDVLERNSININVNNNEIIMIGEKELGVIKKMKDKVVISIDNINITFKGNDNLDYEFFELVLKKCI